MLYLGYLFGRASAPAQRIMSAVKPVVIFVLGGPGAGKGTQCERIVKVKYCTCKFTSYQIMQTWRLRSTETICLG